MPDQKYILGLPEAVSPEAKKWAAVFDFDTNSCYPAAAVSPDGAMNGGLQETGSNTGGCRAREQLDNANTYTRSKSISKDGATYRVDMYALYFPKDQVSPGIGHRHDWEYALVWTKNGLLTHASFSAHGDVHTLAKEQLNFDPDRSDTVKVVYHKEGGGSNVFRPAKLNEPAENPRGWYTPTLVEWKWMQSAQVSNQQLRRQFNDHDFGGANCSFNDYKFPNEIAKNPPAGYPSAQEWKEPPRPAGLVTRWHVLPEPRAAERDNREVNLRKGQQAQIIVHLPEERRGAFYFNLKHDKHGADDRGRTPRITHGALVSGDAHDWPSFGQRIYLGERGDANHNEFGIPGGGFYVDLVLV